MTRDKVEGTGTELEIQKMAKLVVGKRRAWSFLRCVCKVCNVVFQLSFEQMMEKDYLLLFSAYCNLLYSNLTGKCLELQHTSNFPSTHSREIIIVLPSCCHK